MAMADSGKAKVPRRMKFRTVLAWDRSATARAERAGRGGVRKKRAAEQSRKQQA